MTQKGTLRLEGLRKEFDDVVAVDGIDLEVSAGEFFTLLGPSGCGKTTILRCIAGLETPTAGDVYLDGQRITDLPPNKRNTSIIFQEWALFPHMTVGENVSFGLKMDGVPKTEREERVAEVLEVVELGGYQDRQSDELSGGQKQRVAMARSLVQEPEVLLLDEPLASLDRALRDRLQVELKNIQEEFEVTFIHVTHDQEEALTMSDRAGVVNEGSLEQVGKVTELYERPTSTFVAEFLGETNLFQGRAEVKNGMVTLSDDDLQIDIETDRFSSNPSDTTHAYTIRPESMHIASEDLDCTNTWTGTVRNVIYKGSNTLYEVAIGVRTMKVQRQRRKDIEMFDENESVLVGFDSQDGELIVEN
ncbi:Fe3+/spermidine/putrescine ABC transporter ATP-binding protein [Halobacteriales archaeon SW_10_66_29]|nr:MAG: Fe3+/spermidine/putrescine ABC transporter ATP-binding protein [Halobacteriales archaeon SW_10_66_29]